MLVRRVGRRPVICHFSLSTSIPSFICSSGRYTQVLIWRKQDFFYVQKMPSPGPRGRSRLQGYGWRSSQAFIVFTAILGLFSETFLFAFIVPILSYMVEVRLQLPYNQTQWITTAMLTAQGFISMISAPIIAHFADKTPNRRTPLLLALLGCLVGTLLLAICSSCMY